MVQRFSNGDAFWRLVLQHLADQVNQMAFFDTAGHDIRLQHNQFGACYINVTTLQLSIGEKQQQVVICCMAPEYHMCNFNTKYKMKALHQWQWLNIITNNNKIMINNISSNNKLVTETYHLKSINYNKMQQGNKP